MIGYWVDAAPVTTDHPGVLATSFVAGGRTMVALASWAESAVEVELDIAFDALGLDPAAVTITAPEIENFQPASTFRPGQAIPVEPGRGWLLIISDR